MKTKKLIILSSILLFFFGCSNNDDSSEVECDWKLIPVLQISNEQLHSKLNGIFSNLNEK
jgi:hypothetical protein